MNSIIFEQWYPRVFGAASAVAAWGLCAKLGIGLPQGEEMLSSVVSLGGVLAGFLATMKTLLMDMKQETIDRLRRSGYMEHLRNYISEALWASLILCVVAISGFSSSIGLSNVFYLSFLTGLLVYAFSCLYRVTRIGMALLAER